MKSILVSLSISMCLHGMAQNVAINTTGNTAHQSAILDISSAGKGLLIPRLTTVQRMAILNPATGLLVFDTQNNVFMYYNGSQWAPIAGSGGTNQWAIQGNSSTNPVTDFVGTTDNQPLNFRVNNQKSGRIDLSANAFFGYRAGNNNTTGFSNTALGMDALHANQTGHQLVAIGDSALYFNTIGLGNVAVGGKAQYSRTSGNLNTAIGYSSMRLAFSGDGNNAFGPFSLMNTLGYNNSAFGMYAMVDNLTGSGNSAFGNGAAQNNTTGDNNTAIGNSAMTGNSTGYNNTAVGDHAMSSNATGSMNSALGYNSLGGNFYGQYNTGLGAETATALSSQTNSTAVGAFARAGASNTLVLGSIEGVNGASASVNVGIGTTVPTTKLQIEGGTDASYSATSGYLVTGSTFFSNIVIDDNEIIARNNGGPATLFLQASGGSVKIGNASAPSHLLELATNSAGKPGSNTWTVTSDARLKKDVIPFQDGLDVLMQVNPVWFKYNGNAGIIDTARYVGILAQEMQEIAPYSVSEYTFTDTDNSTTNYLSYDGNAMTYILINAVQEQQQFIDSLRATELVRSTEAEMLTTRLQLLEEANAELRDELQTLRLAVLTSAVQHGD